MALFLGRRVSSSSSSSPSCGAGNGSLQNGIYAELLPGEKITFGLVDIDSGHMLGGGLPRIPTQIAEGGFLFPLSLLNLGIKREKHVFPTGTQF